jgi:uncharacterized repeat protein (TIGR01451 family)
MLSAGTLVTGTLAATPPVFLSVAASPPSATQGATIGFTITVDNQGTSNVSQSSVDATIPAGTTYAGVFPASTVCSTTTSGHIICSLGSIKGNTTVVYALAFTTTPSTSSPAVMTVVGATTGVPGDPGGNSHGDNFQCNPNQCTASTTLRASGDPDFSGRFVTGSNLLVQDNQSVGSANLQATKLQAPFTGIGASVEDGPGVGPLGPCGSGDHPVGSAVCAAIFGQTSSIVVSQGQSFGSPFPVTVTFSKYEIPGGINQNNIAIYHSWTDGSGFHEEVISDRCTFNGNTPTNPQCIAVTKTSDGLVVTGWLFHNGRINGW